MISLWKFVCGWRYRQHHKHFDQTPATGLLRMSLLQQRVSVNSQDSTVFWCKTDECPADWMVFLVKLPQFAVTWSFWRILNRCETSKTLFGYATPNQSASSNHSQRPQVRFSKWIGATSWRMASSYPLSMRGWTWVVKRFTWATSLWRSICES